MNYTEIQRLKKQVVTQQVKKLSIDTKRILSTITSGDTWMEKATIYLMNLGELSLDLIDFDRTMSVNKYPRYIKILITHQYLVECVPVSNTQLLKMYQQNITEYPTCSVCSNKVKWRTHRRVFTKQCSHSCRAKDIDVNNKRKQTCVDKYGYDKSLANKKHEQQTRKACYTKHKVEYPFQSKEVIQKTVGSKIHKYGDDYATVISELSLSALQHNHKSPGKTFGQISSQQHFIDKKKNTRLLNWLPDRLEKFKNIAVPDFEFDEFKNRKQYLPYTCVKCSIHFTDNLIDGSVPRCPQCFPLRQTTFMENEILLFVQELLPSTEILSNIRSVIPPKELDIYIPSLNIAIEFNGIYWHSIYGSRGRVDKNYHHNKSIECAKKGIRLIHIFDDEWIESAHIIQSILKQLLTRNDNVTYGRKCHVKELQNDQCRAFTNANHLQGHASAKCKLGLFEGDELLSIMTFSKSRFDKNAQWEMYRYCTKINHSVVGGANKLFKHFVQLHKPNQVITYADNRIFTGSVYTKLGFVFSHNTKPGFWYVDLNNTTTRLNRLRFQKHKLQGVLDVFDSNLTADQNMTNNHFTKVYDCGQSVYVYYPN
jgi:hypothetical protein